MNIHISLTSRGRGHYERLGERSRLIADIGANNERVVGARREINVRHTSEVRPHVSRRHFAAVGISHSGGVVGDESVPGAAQDRGPSK